MNIIFESERLFQVRIFKHFLKIGIPSQVALALALPSFRASLSNLWHFAVLIYGFALNTLLLDMSIWTKDKVNSLNVIIKFTRWRYIEQIKLASLCRTYGSRVRRSGNKTSAAEHSDKLLGHTECAAESILNIISICQLF